jgi:hypothetical protein
MANKKYWVYEPLEVPGYRTILTKVKGVTTPIGSVALYWLDETVNALNAASARPKARKKVRK